MNAVDNLSGDGSETRRRIATELISLHPAPPTLARLEALLNDDAVLVRRAASRAVRRLAQRFDASGAPGEWDAFLADALVSYSDHRAQAVLDAALLALRRPGPRLRAMLRDPGSPAHFPLRGALRRARWPGARRAALVALAADPLAPAALERLRASDAPEEHDDTLAARHLLLHPARRARLRALDAAHLPHPHDWGALSESARRGLITWLGALRMPAQERAESLAILASDPCLDVSIAAERALARLHASAPPPARTPAAPRTIAGPIVAVRRIPGPAGPARAPANPATIALARDILRARGVAV